MDTNNTGETGLGARRAYHSKLDLARILDDFFPDAIAIHAGLGTGAASPRPDFPIPQSRRHRLSTHERAQAVAEEFAA